MASAILLAAMMTAGTSPAAAPPPAPRATATGTASARILRPVTLRWQNGRATVGSAGNGETDTHRAQRADRIDAIDFF